MQDIIFTLSTHGWKEAVEEDNDTASTDRLVERFAVPLQGHQENTKKVVKEMILHATQYIALNVLTCCIIIVWWRLFHALNFSEWVNVLVLNEFFSLPASNGKLEQVFSLLGTIKVEKHSQLSNKGLDDLLLLNSD